MDTLTPVLTDNWDQHRSWTLAAYQEQVAFTANLQRTREFHPRLNRPILLFAAAARMNRYPIAFQRFFGR